MYIELNSAKSTKESNMTKLVKLLVIGGSSTAVAGGAAAGVAVAVTNKKESKTSSEQNKEATKYAVPTPLAVVAPQQMAQAVPTPVKQLTPKIDYTIVPKDEVEFEQFERARHEAHIRELAQQQEQINADRYETMLEERAAQELKLAHEMKNDAEEKRWNYEATKAAHLAEIAGKDANIKFQVAAELSAKANAILNHESSTYSLITPSQLNNLRGATEVLDNILKSITEEINTKNPGAVWSASTVSDAIDQANKNVLSAISAIEANKIPNAPIVEPIVEPALPPVVVPQLAPKIAPSVSAEWIYAHTFHAGDFAREFSSEFLANFSAQQLTQAKSYGNYFAFKHLEEIQNTIRSIFLKHFPLLTDEFNEFVKDGNDVLYYAEDGRDNYGIRFNLLNYLLNPENFNKGTFSEFTRASWDQMGSHVGQFNGYNVGQSHLGDWTIDHKHGNEYDKFFSEKLDTFFKSLDSNIASNPQWETHNQDTFNQSVDAFKAQQFENKLGVTALSWASTAKGLVFKGENDVEYVVLSALPDASDPSIVNCVFTTRASWVLPQTFTKSFGGFKTVDIKSFEAVWPKLKALVGNDSDAQLKAKIAEFKEILSTTYPQLRSQIESQADVDGVLWIGIMRMIQRENVKAFVDLKNLGLHDGTKTIFYTPHFDDYFYPGKTNNSAIKPARAAAQALFDKLEAASKAQ